MVKIQFQNNITKANAATFNTMQDNIEDAIDTKQDALIDSGWTLIDNNIYYKKVGKEVSIIRQARNNSGSYIQNEIVLNGYDYTNITTSIPASIRPSYRIAFPVFIHFTDNTFANASYGEIQTDGKLSIYNWASQKTANRIVFCFTYTID